MKKRGGTKKKMNHVPAVLDGEAIITPEKKEGKKEKKGRKNSSCDL